jgi:NTP pyrophosphatase (non-canonical NTP hydrolase)
MHITIDALERYLGHRYGGWGIDESMFMKLVEEMGEVAEVLNKKSGRKASEQEDLKEELGIELADMLHYILAIAALNDLDMERIILEKDKKASQKYHHDINLEQFLQNT